MKNYSGWEWLLIDAANQFGLDKLTFEKRIEWAEEHLVTLEALTDAAETKPLYAKAVMAIRKAQRGEATGHQVGVDACCSGIQVMSALTGCVAGARATGMIDPDRRADAYRDTTQLMNLSLAGHDISTSEKLYEAYYIELNKQIEAAGGVKVSRADAKDAVMTSFYGSKKTPKEIFGEDTPELDAFYQAALAVAPGAWELLQDLLASWQPYALSHDWKLPDGFDARVKVMVKREVRLEVDELDHATFTYEFYENEGSKTGLSNVANMTHSVDAYILREMHRRCNYDREVVGEAARVIEIEMIKRSMGSTEPQVLELSSQMAYYLEQYQRSSLVSAVIIPLLDEVSVQHLMGDHLEALATIVNGMLEYDPFPLVTVHDEFKAHANNINWVRWQYKEILAEIADSEVLDDLLSQIHGTPGTFNKLSFNLGDQIRASNYALT